MRLSRKFALFGFVAYVAFVVAMFLTGVAKAEEAPAPKAAFVVTSCSKLVLIVFVTKEGQIFVADRDSGIPAADALALAVRAEQKQAYEVGCAPDKTI